MAGLYDTYVRGTGLQEMLANLSDWFEGEDLTEDQLAMKRRLAGGSGDLGKMIMESGQPAPTDWGRSLGLPRMGGEGSPGRPVVPVNINNHDRPDPLEIGGLDLAALGKIAPSPPTGLKPRDSSGGTSAQREPAEIGDEEEDEANTYPTINSQLEQFGKGDIATALIAAGLTGAGDLLNNKAQRKANKKARKAAKTANAVSAFTGSSQAVMGPERASSDLGDLLKVLGGVGATYGKAKDIQRQEANQNTMDQYEREVRRWLADQKLIQQDVVNQREERKLGLMEQELSYNREKALKDAEYKLKALEAKGAPQASEALKKEIAETRGFSYNMEQLFGLIDNAEMSGAPGLATANKILAPFLPKGGAAENFATAMELAVAAMLNRGRPTEADREAAAAIIPHTSDTAEQLAAKKQMIREMVQLREMAALQGYTYSLSPFLMEGGGGIGAARNAIANGIVTDRQREIAGMTALPGYEGRGYGIPMTGIDL